MKRLASLTTLALGLALSSPAGAALLQFDLTGSRQASFRIDTNTIPDTHSASVFGDQIQYLSVPGIYGGVAETATIGFGTNIFAQLNVLADGLGFTQFGGPDLFSGDPMHPTFNLGTFALTSIVSGASSIEISQITSTPEPSTWAMMILGLASLGFLAHRRSSRASVPAGRSGEFARAGREVFRVAPPGNVRSAPEAVPVEPKVHVENDAPSSRRRPNRARPGIGETGETVGKRKRENGRKRCENGDTCIIV